jgi:hypothetical protein
MREDAEVASAFAIEIVTVRTVPSLAFQVTVKSA